MADAERAAQDERQLVVFRLADEEYGVDVSTVREIIHPQQITRVPNAPEFVEGVINLRGRVCPVVDLRKRFDVAVGETTAETRIVIVDIEGEDVGVIVDAVTEVLTITAERLSEASEVLTFSDSDTVEGIADVGERLVILVGLATVLSNENGGAPSREGDATE